MLRNNPNDQVLIDEFKEHIKSPEANQAFQYMLDWADSLEKYECYPTIRKIGDGDFRDFQFWRGENQDFAFIPNKHEGLLFYFREDRSKIKYPPKSIRSRFPDANENTSGEFTVRISSLEDAKAVSSFIDDPFAT